MNLLFHKAPFDSPYTYKTNIEEAEGWPILGPKNNPQHLKFIVTLLSMTEFKADYHWWQDLR